MSDDGKVCTCWIAEEWGIQSLGSSSWCRHKMRVANDTYCFNGEEYLNVLIVQYGDD